MTRLVIPFPQGDPARVPAAFTAVGWNKSIALFEWYLKEHDSQTRHAVLAEVDGAVAGYVTLVGESKYPPSAKQGIPEVSDLNVLPDHRRCRVATRLLDYIECFAGQRSPTRSV